MAHGESIRAVYQAFHFALASSIYLLMQSGGIFFPVFESRSWLARFFWDWLCGLHLGICRHLTDPGSDLFRLPIHNDSKARNDARRGTHAGGRTHRQNGGREPRGKARAGSDLRRATQQSSWPQVLDSLGSLLLSSTHDSSVAIEILCALMGSRGA